MIDLSSKEEQARAEAMEFGSVSQRRGLQPGPHLQIEVNETISPRGPVFFGPGLKAYRTPRQGDSRQHAELRDSLLRESLLFLEQEQVNYCPQKKTAAGEASKDVSFDRRIQRLLQNSSKTPRQMRNALKFTFETKDQQHKKAHQCFLGQSQSNR